MTSRTETQELFKVDLQKAGLLPIFLVAENRSDSASFVIAKEKVQVLDAATGTTSGSQRTKVKSEKGGNTTAVVGAALLPVTLGVGAPLLFAGMKMASDATVIQHNLGANEFYSRTLDPGQRAQGFIYFQYPPEPSLASDYHLTVELKDSASGKIIPVDVPVRLTLRP